MRLKSIIEECTLLEAAKYKAPTEAAIRKHWGIENPNTAAFKKKLKTKAGSDFDKAFADAMVEYEEMIKLAQEREKLIWDKEQELGRPMTPTEKKVLRNPTESKKEWIGRLSGMTARSVEKTGKMMDNYFKLVNAAFGDAEEAYAETVKDQTSNETMYMDLQRLIVVEDESIFNADTGEFKPYTYENITSFPVVPRDIKNAKKSLLLEPNDINTHGNATEEVITVSNFNNYREAYIYSIASDTEDIVDEDSKYVLVKNLITAFVKATKYKTLDMHPWFEAQAKAKTPIYTEFRETI